MKSFKELIGGLDEARLFASYQDAAAAAAPGQKPKLDPASNKYILVREETIAEAQVSTKKYSWGTMKTIHHGSDFSIPLHPEHHKAIAKLKDEQEHSFKTEDGKSWTARRKGDDVHFQGANNGGTTKVAHSTMKEEVEMDEQAPVAPVPAKKYIKGTPENKAARAASKPINGAPTDFKDYLLKRKIANEEVEQIEELSKTTLKSYTNDAALDAVRLGNSLGRAQLGKSKTAAGPVGDKITKRLSGIRKATDKMTKEEVQIDEANHREFASQGKMHPDMAKHMSVGQDMDYYEPKTGDKVSGKVMHKSDTEVHMKQTHDSYDPKKKGSVHKFKVSSTLDEQSDAELDSLIFEVLSKDAAAAEWIHDFIHSDNPKFDGKSKEKRKQMALAAYYSKQRNEEVQKADIPAYLRKAKGDKPLELKDLKRKDTLSDAENLAKNRGVKEQQEGNMKTYKEFVTEIKMSDLPSRSVKGSSYGAQYDDPEGADDADDKKPAKAADAPKRGRGRPAGSTSGARQQGSAKQSKTGGADYTGYKVHLPNRNK